MALKSPQGSNHNLKKSPESSSPILSTIYASRFRKNSPNLLPLKLDSPQNRSKDLYNFQRTLVSSRISRLTETKFLNNKNPEKHPFRQTFSISKGDDPRTKNHSLNKDDHSKETSRMISSDGKRSYRIKIENKNTDKMNKTSDNFRPSTGFRRCVDEERSNYLNRY